MYKIQRQVFGIGEGGEFGRHSHCEEGITSLTQRTQFLLKGRGALSYRSHTSCEWKETSKFVLMTNYIKNKWPFPCIANSFYTSVTVRKDAGKKCVTKKILKRICVVSSKFGNDSVTAENKFYTARYARGVNWMLMGTGWPRHILCPS